MSLPVLERSWEFSLNQRYVYGGTIADLYNIALYNMKETWKGWSVGAMTVAGSSDASSSWGWTGTDYWTSPTFPSNNNPWIVLNMNGGGQILLYRTTTAYTTHGHYSPGGLYTGGGLNTVPTATDEVQMWTNYIFGTMPANDWIFNYWHSTDGDCEYFLAYGNDNLLGTNYMFTIYNAVENWEDQRVWSHDDTDNNQTVSRLHENQNFNFVYSGSSYAAALTTLGWQEFAVAEISQLQTNQITGKHPMIRVGLACRTVGARGWHGRVPDMYFGSESTANGSFIEEDVDNPQFKWIQIGVLILPWDGVETSLVTS